MINVRSLKKLKENDGLTLKNGKPIVYKSGQQVATEGLETTDPIEAMKMIKAYGGNCGIWFSNGAAGIDPDDEDFADYPYEENIADNSTWEEISEEEYRKLVDEEYWEERSY